MSRDFSSPFSSCERFNFVHDVLELVQHAPELRLEAHAQVVGVLRSTSASSGGRTALLANKSSTCRSIASKSRPGRPGRPAPRRAPSPCAAARRPASPRTPRLPQFLVATRGSRSQRRGRSDVLLIRGIFVLVASPTASRGGVEIRQHNPSTGYVIRALTAAVRLHLAGDPHESARFGSAHWRLADRRSGSLASSYMKFEP